MKKKLIVGLASAMLAGTFVSATSFAAELTKEEQAKIERDAREAANKKLTAEDVAKYFADLAAKKVELNNKIEELKVRKENLKLEITADANTLSDRNQVVIAKKEALDKATAVFENKDALRLKAVANVRASEGFDKLNAAEVTAKEDAEFVALEATAKADMEAAAKAHQFAVEAYNDSVKKIESLNAQRKANIQSLENSIVKLTNLLNEVVQSEVDFRKADKEGKFAPSVIARAQKAIEKAGVATKGEEAKAEETKATDAKKDTKAATKATAGKKALAKTGVATSGVALGGLVAVAAAAMLRRRAK